MPVRKPISVTVVLWKVPGPRAPVPPETQGPMSGLPWALLPSLSDMSVGPGQGPLSPQRGACKASQVEALRSVVLGLLETMLSSLMTKTPGV